MMQKIKVAFTIRAYNETLTRKCMGFLLNQNKYPVFPCFGTQADTYLLDIIYRFPYDYIINIDEDAFVFNMDALFSLFEHFRASEFAVCGLSEAALPWRRANPFSLNPFFNIFNSKIIRSVSKSDLCMYGRDFDCLSRPLPDKVKDMPHKFSVNEPYYPIFFGFHVYNMPILYLERTDYTKDGMVKPGYADIVMNQNNQPFLSHTAHAREYGKSAEQTERINEVLHWSAHQAGQTQPVSLKKVYAFKCAGIFVLVLKDGKRLAIALKNLFSALFGLIKSCVMWR